MKKNGKTKNGCQRYYCRDCHASFTLAKKSLFTDFDVFLDYVTRNYCHHDYGIPARTLRFKISRFWQYWPLPPLVREHYDVVFVDGIYLSRTIVILIACTTTHIIGWYVARSETSQAYSALLSRIAAPTIAVSDGGPGFRKACKHVWPTTKIQRCLFHVYMTIRTATTLHPRLLPGQQLLRIGKSLLKGKTLDHAVHWVTMYSTWYETWHDWLDEKTLVDSRYQDTHQALAKAARSINTLIRQDQMFTNLDAQYQFHYKNRVILTNNQIEGGVNTQLRSLLRAHRGMKRDRQIKTVFWYCYTHSTASQDPHEYLSTMPTDHTMTRLYHAAYKREQWLATIPSWEDTAVYTEFHTTDSRNNTD